MKRTTLIFLSIIGFYSCKHDYTVPADFNFSLSYGYFGDQISTFDSTFRRNPTMPGSIPIKVVFTKDEMNRIYKKMIQNDYLDIPHKLGPEEHPVPFPEYHLVINANSKKSVISLTGNGAYTGNKNIEKFDSITNEIIHVLYSKKEFKRLPPDHRIAL